MVLVKKHNEIAIVSVIELYFWLYLRMTAYTNLKLANVLLGMMVSGTLDFSK